MVRYLRNRIDIVMGLLPRLLNLITLLLMVGLPAHPQKAEWLVGDSIVHQDLTHQLPTIRFPIETIITTKQIYEQVFQTMNQDTLPPIDFTSFTLIGKKKCSQCAVFCQHELNMCHRNACSYTYQWLLIENEKVKEITQIEVIEHQGIFWESCKTWIKTTEIRTPKELKAFQSKCEVTISTIDFENEMILLRRAGGDCRATFTHEFYLDHSRKVLVWKLYNKWGRCRAGGSFKFAVKIPKPPVGYNIEYEQILIE